MPRIVLDTDVASLSYKGRLPGQLAARLAGNEICVTFVTVGELARWAEKRHWGTRARTELVTWLGRRVILPYDERVAWKWGQLSILAEQRGRARPVNDTWIAACCIVAELPLATLNVKDFEDFAAHDGLRVIGPDGRLSAHPASGLAVRGRGLQTAVILALGDG